MSSELPIVTKKKKGPMRRLKGLITGKSRRDKKKAKHAASLVESNNAHKHSIIKNTCVHTHT